MIKIENIEVVGLEPAIRGMRNPMNSWEKSDSKYDENNYILGTHDQILMQKLAKGGSVHAKYRRMIVVYMDIVAPLYFWKEFDTYKVGTVANSCSTMHKIHAKEFTLEDFSCEHLFPHAKETLQGIIDLLNYYRDIYVNGVEHDEKTHTMGVEPGIKDFWWQMIQLLPSSYNQRRTVMLNYEVLTNIYKSRKDHKLDEWRDFCKMIEELPYSIIICGGGD